MSVRFVLSAAAFCVVGGLTACGSDSTAPSTAPVRLAFVAEPGGASGGSPFATQPAVQVLDGAGRRVTAANSSVTLMLLPGNPVGRLAGTTVVAAAGGLASFADLSIDLAASGYALVAASPGLRSDTSTVFTVSPGAAARLRFATDPGQARGGDPFGQQPVVEIIDLGGNRVAVTLDVTVALDSGPAGATIAGSSTVASAAGTAPFSGLSVDKAGAGYRLVATAAGMTSAVSARFDVAVGPPSLTRSYVTSRWTLMNVGDTTTLTLYVRDNGGNAVTAPLSSWQFGDPPGPYVGHSNGDGSYSAVVVPTGGATQALVTGSVNGAVLQSPPVLVRVVRFTQLSAGGGHTCGLSFIGEDGGGFYGDLYCWGDGEYGQLGNGGTASSVVPVLVPGGIHWASVSAGGTHTCGVDTNGEAYCWGRNAHGALGIGEADAGSSTDRSVPTPVAGGLIFEDLIQNSLVRTVHAGLGSTTCGSVQGFKMYCWGNNASGQLGDSATTDSPVPVLVSGGHLMNNVAVGSQHACATSYEDGSDSTIFCWGSDSAGALGLAAAAVSDTCHGGPCALFPVPVTVRARMVTQVWRPSLDLGGAHACLQANTISGNSPLWCWGANGSGQLGDGTATDRADPVHPVGQPLLVPSFLATGERHTCATIASTLYCWGDNAYGQLGDGTQVSRTSPTAVAGALVFPQFVGYAPFAGSIGAGARHTCTVAGDDHTYCWGDNAYGQLGTGNTTSSLVPVRIAIRR